MVTAASTFIFPPNGIFRPSGSIPPFEAIPIPLGIGGPGQQHTRPLPFLPHNGQQLRVEPPPVVGGERKRGGVAMTVTDIRSVIHQSRPWSVLELGWLGFIMFRGIRLVLGRGTGTNQGMDERVRRVQVREVQRVAGYREEGLGRREGAVEQGQKEVQEREQKVTELGQATWFEFNIHGPLPFFGLSSFVCWATRRLRSSFALALPPITQVLPPNSSTTTPSSSTSPPRPWET